MKDKKKPKQASKRKLIMESVGSWMSLDDLAEYLKVSKVTLYRMLTTKKGTIPKHRIGKQYRFSKSEIDAWVLSK